MNARAGWNDNLLDKAKSFSQTNPERFVTADPDSVIPKIFKFC